MIFLWGMTMWKAVGVGTAAGLVGGIAYDQLRSEIDQQELVHPVIMAASYPKCPVSLLACWDLPAPASSGLLQRSVDFDRGKFRTPSLGPRGGGMVRTAFYPILVDGTPTSLRLPEQAVVDYLAALGKIGNPGLIRLNESWMPLCLPDPRRAGVRDIGRLFPMAEPQHVQALVEYVTTVKQTIDTTLAECQLRLAEASTTDRRLVRCSALLSGQLLRSNAVPECSDYLQALRSRLSLRGRRLERSFKRLLYMPIVPDGLGVAVVGVNKQPVMEAVGNRHSFSSAEYQDVLRSLHFAYLATGGDPTTWSLPPGTVADNESWVGLYS